MERQERLSPRLRTSKGPKYSQDSGRFPRDRFEARNRWLLLLADSDFLSGISLHLHRTTDATGICVQVGIPSHSVMGHLKRGILSCKS